MPNNLKREINNIALFLPSLRCGGAERVMVNLARGFAERGQQVDMVLAKAEGPYMREVPPEVRIVDLGAKRMLYSLPALVRYLRRVRPDAMLSAMNHSNIVAIWARQLAGVKTRLIISEHNTLSVSVRDSKSTRERLMPTLMKLFYRWADAIVVVSRGVMEDLISTTKIPREKVRVIYNPVVTPELLARAEEPLEHPWFAGGEPPVILGVGRLVRQKDFATLIRAFALVRMEQPVRLIIIGEGEERDKLEALLRTLGLEQDVALPGFVENPYKYMKRAAVFVLSSRYEGLSNVLVEAMAVGTPVVSTDCPSGPMEILESGRWGKLVPVGDIQAMAAAVVAALNETKCPDTRHYIQKFGLHQVVLQYLNVLEMEYDP